MMLSDSQRPVMRSGLQASMSGLTWDQTPAGWTTRTLARTLTESDLTAYVALAGLFEPLFLDERESAPRGGRLVPGMLTLSIAEGLVIQTQMIQGTGVALLSLEVSVRAPVFVGDTIDVELEVTESRETSKPGRGIVTARNRIFNQRDELVSEYTTRRLIAGPQQT